MGIKLSDKELEAMDGLPHLHRCLYIFGIRRYMDYATGITGVKRKISYKSLSEEVYVIPHQGHEISGAPSHDQVKRVLKRLEKKGLITIHSKTGMNEKQLILKCILASWDRSVQNKPALNPPCSAALEAALDTVASEKQEKHYKNSGIEHGATATKEDETRPASRPVDFEKAARHPVSGKDTKLNYTVPPVDNFLTTDENKFLNLFTDLKLNLKLAGDLEAILTAKALVKASVSVQTASDAIKTKLNAYYKNNPDATTPHPAYFKAAIINYHKKLQEIDNPQEEMNNNDNLELRRAQIQHNKLDKRAEAYRRLAAWAAKEDDGQENDPEFI